MNKAALQQYCLQLMGITQWRIREVPNTRQFPYLFCLPQAKKVLSKEEQQLLQRLMQALHWPEQQVAIHALKENTTSFFQSTVTAVNPHKIVIFCTELAQALGFKQVQSLITITQPTAYSLVIVSSLEKLLTDKVAKKEAWQILQPFINH